MTQRNQHIHGLAKAIGWTSALHILSRRAIGMEKPVIVTSGGERLVLRPKESDLFVASQIFGRDEYQLPQAYLDGLHRLSAEWVASGATPVIIDGGANVGHSSLYFSKKFPGAKVIAVEPDAETFAQIEKNCAGRTDIIPVYGAIWKHEDGVSLSNTDDASWARSVVDSGLTPSFTLESLMNLVPGGRLLVLKLDIEGAEREVIAASSATVRSAPCILIEPHDFMLPGACTVAPLYSALAGKQVDTLLSGENLIICDSALIQRA